MLDTHITKFQIIPEVTSFQLGVSFQDLVYELVFFFFFYEDLKCDRCDPLVTWEFTWLGWFHRTGMEA